MRDCEISEMFQADVDALITMELESEYSKQTSFYQKIQQYSISINTAVTRQFSVKNSPG